MEVSVCEFDTEHQLLRHQKLHLDWQLNGASLRQLTLNQELLLLIKSERREDSLQEKLNGYVKEENSVTVGGRSCTRGLIHVDDLFIRSVPWCLR